MMKPETLIRVFGLHAVSDWHRVQGIHPGTVHFTITSGPMTVVGNQVEMNGT